MATDFGIDIACTDDIDPTLRVVSGRDVLKHRVFRRLTNFRGCCIDADDHGYDLRDELGDDVDDRKLYMIRARIRQELSKEEELISSNVDAATFNRSLNGGTLTIKLTLEDGDGPFPLVLAVSAVSIDLLAE